MYEQYSDKFENIYQAVPKGKVFRLTYDSTINMMKLISRERNLLEEIRDAFSIDNDQAFFSKQYGYSSEKKKYAINAFGYFAPGLVFEVLNWIKTNYGDMSFVAISKNCMSYIVDILLPLKTTLNGKTFEIENISEESGRNKELILQAEIQRAKGIPENLIKQPFFYREYLIKSLQYLFFKGFGKGLIEIPTSGGKSFIIANFIWNYHKNVDLKAKVLIFVPNTQLVELFYGDLIDYGYRKEHLAKFTGSLKAKERKEQDVNTAKIIIANRQYVFSNKKKLPNIDVLICDEVHQTLAGATSDYIKESEAKVKIGCSGTIPKNKFDLWILLGMFGKVLYEEKVTDLQDLGYISKLKITLLDIMHKNVENNRHYLFHTDSLHKYKPDEQGNSEVLFNDAYNAEQDFYLNNSFDLYKPVLEYLNLLDENILVLFDRIETGKNIFEQAKEIVTNKKAYYIDGSTVVAEREAVRCEFEKSGNNILVGNVSILGTGINIKRLSHLVFLCNTKSFSRTVLSIGRTLRLHATKQEAHLIDVRYNFKYSRKHFDDRMKIYKLIYQKKKLDEVIKMEI